MPEGAESQYPSKIEHLDKPFYNQETLQYHDNQLALHLTGELRALFDFKKHKYSPTELRGEAIVSTKSGNDYYIFTSDRTYVMNTHKTDDQGKLVGYYKEFPVELPPIEFGKPWNVPGLFQTSDVDSLLLRYKKGDNGRRIDEGNPFD